MSDVGVERLGSWSVGLRKQIWRGIGRGFIHQHLSRVALLCKVMFLGSNRACTNRVKDVGVFSTAWRLLLRIPAK